MASYVATPDDFDALFDAMQNAVLPFKQSSLYVAMPNTFSNIETTTVKAAKKNSTPASTRVQRAPTALTPEFSRYLVLADQERFPQQWKPYLLRARIYRYGLLPFAPPGLRQNQPHRVDQAQTRSHPQDHVSPIIPRKRIHPWARKGNEQERR